MRIISKPQNQSPEKRHVGAPVADLFTSEEAKESLARLFCRVVRELYDKEMGCYPVREGGKEVRISRTDTVAVVWLLAERQGWIKTERSFLSFHKFLQKVVDEHDDLPANILPARINIDNIRKKTIQPNATAIVTGLDVTDVSLALSAEIELLHTFYVMMKRLA